MLKIPNRDWWRAFLARAATESAAECLPKLVDKLDYLSHYGAPDGNVFHSTECTLTPDIGSGLGALFTVVVRDAEGFARLTMHGGLIYHSDGTWGVHT